MVFTPRKREGGNLQLNLAQCGYLEAVARGISETEAFIAAMTDYHGGPVRTEYLLTYDVARVLFHDGHEVAIEYLINKVRNFSLIRDFLNAFTLGSQRFDVVVLKHPAPVFIVEVKIKVASLRKLKPDLEKIMSYLDCLTLDAARHVLGAVIFQTHVKALRAQDLSRTKRRIWAIERTIYEELSAFELRNPRYAFDWLEFQDPSERIYDDQIDQDGDGSPMLGDVGHATRYHAILIQRSC